MSTMSVRMVKQKEARQAIGRKESHDNSARATWQQQGDELGI